VAGRVFTSARTSASGFSAFGTLDNVIKNFGLCLPNPNRRLRTYDSPDSELRRLLRASDSESVWARLGLMGEQSRLSPKVLVRGSTPQPGRWEAPSRSRSNTEPPECGNLNARDRPTPSHSAKFHRPGRERHSVVTVVTVGAKLKFQPRTQHSRVGMLRQNNQHTPARVAVLAAVLRHTGSLEWWVLLL
jgi:hypothetical protein